MKSGPLVRSDMEADLGESTKFLNLRRRTISGSESFASPRLSFVLNTPRTCPLSRRVLFCGSQESLPTSAPNFPNNDKDFHNFCWTTSIIFHRKYFFRACFWSFVTSVGLKSIIQRPSTIRGAGMSPNSAIIHERLAADVIFSVISSIIFCVRCSVAYFRYGSRTFKGDSIFEIWGRTVIENFSLPLVSMACLGIRGF